MKKKNPHAVALGRKGGKAKVPKGFAKMDKKRLQELGRASAKKRAAKSEKPS